MDTGRLFVPWTRRVQRLVPPASEISWSNMEYLLAPTCLVRIRAG
jgi:hypothetical protein